MIIEPRTHKTCANDRAVLCAALENYINLKKRRIAMINSSKAGEHVLKPRRDEAEMKMARAQDLLETFK